MASRARSLSLHVFCLRVAEIQQLHLIKAEADRWIEAGAGGLAALAQT